MNPLLDDDQDLMPRRERELTLSTSAILGIFFGLVLLCGFFFALGYNLRKPAQPVATTGDAADTASNASTFDHFNKPSAGSPAGQPQKPAETAATPSVPPPTSIPAAETAGAAPPANTTHPVSLPPPPAHETVSAPAPAPMPATSPSGAFTVQVAAVSHQEDAELLVNALRGKGYTVAAHSEPQDKLFHIQIGPFANKKDADAMRQRLLTDGYNAIVK